MYEGMDERSIRAHQRFVEERNESRRRAEADQMVRDNAAALDKIPGLDKVAKSIDRLFSTPAPERTIFAGDSAPDTLSVGQKMEDGTVYVGTMYTDKAHKERVFTTPDMDENTTYTFTEQKQAAEKLNAQNAYQHNDWTTPNENEGSMLRKNWVQARLSPSFNMNRQTWIWTSTPGYSENPAVKTGTALLLQETSAVHYLYQSRTLPVRPIRREPVPA